MMKSPKECNSDRMSIERFFARGFVIIGGIFWASAVFGADYGYRGFSPMVSARNALLPLVLTLFVLGVGWFYERLITLVLAGGALAVAVWGITAMWEPGVWSLVVATLIGPMILAALLYWFAARMQTACTLEATAKRGRDIPEASVPTRG